MQSTDLEGSTEAKRSRKWERFLTYLDYGVPPFCFASFLLFSFPSPFQFSSSPLLSFRVEILVGLKKWNGLNLLILWPINPCESIQVKWLSANPPGDNSSHTTCSMLWYFDREGH
jgi:hypothetical protein